MRISVGSSDVCSSDLVPARRCAELVRRQRGARADHGLSQLQPSGRLFPPRGARAGARYRADVGIRQWRGRRGLLCRHAACEKQFHLDRSEERTSELQSLMRISYAVFCLKKKKVNTNHTLQSKPNKI